MDCVRDALEWARHRLRGRPDSEHEMTPNRMVFTGSVILYLWIATWTGDAAAADEVILRRSLAPEPPL